MAIPIGSVLIAYHMFSMSNIIGQNKYRVLSFIILAVLFLMNYSMVYMYQTIITYFETQHEKEIYHLQINMLSNHMREKEHSMAQLRKTKHDLKNKLLFAIDMIENQDYNSLSLYLRKLSELQPLDQFTIVHTGNSLVDTIINCKYEMARKYDINFQVGIEIPALMPFNTPELCVILGNALDNAIEACCRGKVDNPRIMLKMRYDVDNLIIILENSYDGVIVSSGNGEEETRKSQKDEHGWGLVSIKQLLENYHGYYDVDVQDKLYRLKMILYAK